MDNEKEGKARGSKDNKKSIASQKRRPYVQLDKESFLKIIKTHFLKAHFLVKEIMSSFVEENKKKQ